jgi:putative DNA primase/helicase
MTVGLCLLAALAAEGDIENYRKLALSEKFFFGPEQALFEFINDHVQKHGVLPKLETVSAQSKSLPKPVEPASIYVSGLLERYKHKTLNRALTECNELMKKQDAEAALKVVAKVVSDLQADPHCFGQKPLGEFVMSAAELLGKELPELEMIVDPFLPSASLSLLYSATGVGKTWFSIQLAVSIASGDKFFEWDVPKSRRVLYVDGEMPTKAIQTRLLTLAPKPPENLMFLPSESLWCQGVPLNLNLSEQQARIDQYLNALPVEQKPALVVLDNLSSLSAGIDESSNSDLDNLLRWLVKLRSQGYATLLVHHAGKNGDQRGASRRKDLLDTVIKLNEAPAAHGDGAAFTVTFDKLRGKKPDPLSLTVELDTENGFSAIWHTSAVQSAPAWVQALRIIRDETPKTQKELAERLGVTAAAVSQHLKTARNKGLLTEKLELTESGEKLVEKYYAAKLVNALG